MSKILAIAGRDIQSNLYSFSFYLLAAFFVGVSGFFFFSNINYFSLVCFQVQNTPNSPYTNLNLTDSVLSPYLMNVCVLLLLLVPVLTMRSFAEERKMGTLELLYTYPVSNLQILMGKFLGSVALILILMLPTLIYYPMAQVIGARFEMISILTGYFGFFMVAISFTSLGIFVSSLTDNQTVSAGVGFAVLLFFWIAGMIAEWTSPSLTQLFRELSLVEHLRDFTRGILDSKDIAYFTLFTCFFLFATLSSIEIRTWKR